MPSVPLDPYFFSLVLLACRRAVGWPAREGQACGLRQYGAPADLNIRVRGDRPHGGAGVHAMFEVGEQLGCVQVARTHTAPNVRVLRARPYYYYYQVTVVWESDC